MESKTVLTAYELQAWPFLVSRNKTIDYRTVVAPDFMVDTKTAGLIANKVSSDLTKEPRYKLIDAPLGLLTLVYRVIPATDQDEPRLDDFGRPILWIEGLVLKGDFTDYAIPSEIFQVVHIGLEKDYQEFWSSTTSSVVKRSGMIDLSLEKTGTTPPRESDDYQAQLRALLREKRQLESELQGAEQEYNKGMRYICVGIALIPLLGLGLVPVFIGRSITTSSQERQEDLRLQIHNLDERTTRLHQAIKPLPIDSAAQEMGRAHRA